MALDEIWPSQLGQQNTPLQKGKTPLTNVLL